MTNQRNRMTRNQRKRERIRTAAMVAALLFLWAILAALFLKAWDHPAEEHISGAAYAVSVVGAGDLEW